MRKFIEDQNISGLGFQAEKLLAKLSILHGVSRRTAQEYLSCLLITGEVIEQEGFLWIPSIYYKWKDADKEIKLPESEDKVEKYFKDQELEDIQEVVKT